MRFLAVGFGMREFIDKLVSIVVPVYNTEKYLPDALNSLAAQTYGELEIVLVDDGSTDGSSAICKEFVAKDDRFRYIWQQNAGAGAARNRGIDVANGEYLLFADADDLYEPTLVAKLYDAIHRDGSDVAMCRANLFTGTYGDSPSSPYKSYPQGGSCAPGDIAERLFQSVTYVPWDKLFRAEHVYSNGFRFQTLRYSNDNYFVLMTLLSAARITWLEDVLVHHRVGAGGSLRDKMYLAPTCDLDMLDALRSAFYSGDLRAISGLERSLDSYTAGLVWHSYTILATQEARACGDFWRRLVSKSLPAWESAKGGSLEIDGIKRRLKFTTAISYGPNRAIWAYTILGANGARTSTPDRKRLALLRFLVSPLFVRGKENHTPRS